MGAKGKLLLCTLMALAMTGVGAQSYSSEPGVCTACETVTLPVCDCPPGFSCFPDSPNYPECERCDAGTFCPVRGDRVPPLPCPKGHFCPYGIWIPITCPVGSVCSAKRGFFLLGPFMCVLALAVAFAARRGWLGAGFRKLRRSEAKDGIAGAPVGPGGAPSDQWLLFQHDYLTPLPDDEVSPLGITLDRVCVRAGGKTILSDVSGAFPQGRLTAVMGPSGAGKTTLLRMLLGAGTAAGTIRINGVKASLSKIRRVCGFVPQDDGTMDNLTVRQLLTFHAMLRMPSSTSLAQRRKEVDRALASLSLTDVADQRVAGDRNTRTISGGQRRRVNVACELVAKPRVLVCDEPTSGLDSRAAQQCTSSLRRICETQRVTVIASIHQPSEKVFHTFDDVVLLSKGAVVYWGPVSECLPYFQQLGCAPAPGQASPDAILDYISENGPRCVAAWSDHVPETTHSTAAASAGTLRPLHRSMPNMAFQVAVQAWRGLLRWWHGLHSLMIFAVMFGFSGAFLGIAFMEPKYILPSPSEIVANCPMAVTSITNGQAWNQPCNDSWPTVEIQGLCGLNFSMILAILAVAHGVKTLSNKPVQRREAASSISVTAFFWTQMVFDSLLACVFAFFFASFYFIVADPWGSFGNYWSLIAMFVWSNMGIAYVMSVIFSKQNAVIVSTLLTVAMGVFSGLAFQRVNPTLPSFLFSEGLWRAEAAFIIDNATPDNAYWVGVYADSQYGYHTGSGVIAHDIAIMCAYGAGLRFFAFLLFLGMSMFRRGR